MKRFPLFVIGTVLTAGVSAETVTRPAQYSIDGKAYQGVVAIDSSLEGKRPGILVIPEWWGVNDYVTSRARMLADMGYVAFVADMYGSGQSTTDPAVAGKLSGAVKGDRGIMRQRANAGLAQLKALPQVDPDKTAAIGFCFGGTTVLELARSNADVAGVVSFHGGLDKGDLPTSSTIKPRVVVLHGAADPHVPNDVLAAFKDEMEQANADWYLVAYGHAVHAFTNPNAGNNPSTGLAYNEKADKRSWAEMQNFFHELFPDFLPKGQK